jgi:D-alanyl-D-alanine carboxypeptidase
VIGMENRGGVQRWLTVLLVGGVALAGCSGGTTVESAAPAPVPSWAPLMAVPATDPLPEDTADSLQQVLQDWLAETGLIGATAAVVSADGLWQGASGVDAVGDDLVPASAMAIGSITKTFTAAAVMSLVEEGGVDLDAPLDTYVSMPFETDSATVRQVLNMRSGYPSDAHFEGVTRQAISEDPDRSWTIDEVLGWHAGRTGSDGELGGEQKYKNLNYTALGALVEEVSGRSIAEVVRGELLDPAGLEQTWFQDAEEPQPPLTVAAERTRYEVVDEDGPWLPSRSFASAAGPAGGMAASVTDIARWGYLLYGGFLLEPTSVAEMTRLEQPSDFYGLGTEVLNAPARFGHGGDSVAYHSVLEVSPEDGVSVAILVPEPISSAAYDARTIYDAAEDLLQVVLGA